MTMPGTEPGPGAPAATTDLGVLEFPMEIAHSGNFSDAISDAKTENKLLLVIITNEAVFDCQQMNGDCWNNEVVQAFLSCYFIVWTRPHTDGELSTCYPQLRAGQYPHLAVFDPRTTTPIWFHEGQIENNILLEQLGNKIPQYSL